MTTKQNRPAEAGKRNQSGADAWWASLSPGKRALAKEMARLMDETTDSKRIEIRRERGEIRARFIYILKKPEPGCTSAIVLPQIPAGWN